MSEKHGNVLHMICFSQNISSMFIVPYICGLLYFLCSPINCSVKLRILYGTEYIKIVNLYNLWSFYIFCECCLSFVNFISFVNGLYHLWSNYMFCECCVSFVTFYIFCEWIISSVKCLYFLWIFISFVNELYLLWNIHMFCEFQIFETALFHYFGLGGFRILFLVHFGYPGPLGASPPP